MVYNAMKLFMEINPQLFDDCSHEYAEQQNSAAEREAIRERRWAAVTELANRRKAEKAASANGSAGSSSGGPPQRSVPNTLPRVDEVDVAEDNQKRLDSLKLQDGDRRDRRTHEKQNSVGSSRSQR